MRLRVIDYVANPGGGILFGVELLKALMAAHQDLRVEFVSHGEALERYQSALGSEGVDIPTTDLRPRKYWRHLPPTRTWGIPGTARLKHLLGYGANWRYDVSDSALQNCDVAWFPWLHRHRIPPSRSRIIVGSFHDAIMFLWPDLVPERFLVDERQTLLRWLGSKARIVVSSRSTLATIVQLWHIGEERFRTIPLSGSHMRVPSRSAGGTVWLGQFLLCPANTSPHKNHEVLFKGVAACGLPLVLTGHGTELRAHEPRGGHLRALALSDGFQIGESLIPLGYVTREVYRSLISRAWAVVVPSLMEGGGSFPVFEAMQCGVPVVCSDIPVLREQITRTGGDVVWFNPRDAMDLARKLRTLQAGYDTYKARAVAQVTLLRRTWTDVADEYWAVIEEVAGSRR